MTDNRKEYLDDLIDLRLSVIEINQKIYFMNRDLDKMDQEIFEIKEALARFQEEIDKYE